MIDLTSLPPGASTSGNVVTRRVLINDHELSGEILLLQILIRQSFNKISSASLVFLDGDVSNRDFILSDDDQFKPGSTIEIQLGYDGSSETVFSGIIIKHQIKIKSNGTSLLYIEAKDKSVKLAGARKSQYFTDKKDSEAMEEMIEAAGLDSDVQDTSQLNKQLVQYDATDWDFIVTRAEANGMLVLTNNGTVIVKKPDTTQNPVLTVTYGNNLLDFEAEMDARRQYNQVTAKTWDYAGQQLQVSDPGNASFDENGNISSNEMSGVLGVDKELAHCGNIDSTQLQDWADAYALRSKFSKDAGRFRVPGNADIKPGTMVTLEGVGDRFNGKVWVTGVAHIYHGEWYSDVQFGWNNDPFYTKEDVMDKPASGLLPGVTGLQIGIVSDLDDPDGQFRIKVIIPTITSGNEGVWARVATLDAGNNRGIYFRPQVNDEVVLGFLNDDPNNPVVLGCMHSNDSKKSPLPENEGEEEYGIVTGSGSKIVFNDTQKSVTISVAATDGEKKLVLNDSGNMMLTDGAGNKLTMGTSGITIESKGNITIKGSIVQIN